MTWVNTAGPGGGGDVLPIGSLQAATERIPAPGLYVALFSGMMIPYPGGDVSSWGGGVVVFDGKMQTDNSLNCILELQSVSFDPRMNIAVNQAVPPGDYVIIDNETFSLGGFGIWIATGSFFRTTGGLVKTNAAGVIMPVTIT
jgi:hypothetical protein